MGSRVFSRWAGEGLRILFALASIALLATLASPRRGHADEYVLDFGVDVPKLATFSPRLAIVGTSATVDTELRAEFDQRGKLGGTGTVDGVPVVLTGRLKQTKSEWNAKLLVRNARSTSRRVKLKVTGRVGAGLATAQGHIDGRAVEILGDEQLQSVANRGGGTLTIAVLEKEPGKIVGTGTWDNYHTTTLGRVRLPSGRVRVLIEPVGDPNNCLMDLQELMLIPVK